MTVVLLDPQSPDLLPLAAARLVNGPVLVTEDVAASVLWALPHAEVAATDDGDPMTVLISTDRTHPLVVAREQRGEVVLAPPAEPAPRSGTKLLDAVALMDRLRTTGPWESRQTHESLRRFVLEEVYELLDAIDVGTTQDVRDELGDLLLQVLFHARVAADDPDEPFDIDDVAQAFIDKVTRRTPGVLSGEHSDLQRQIDDWEAAKAAERDQGSILDGIVTTAPALALTQKVLERIAAAGYPRSQVDPALLDVSVEMGSDSVEDATRQRALDLMDMVREAESRARQDGVELAEPAQWLYYLGAASVDVPAAPEPVAPAPAPDPAFPTPTAQPVPTAQPAQQPAFQPVSEPTTDPQRYTIERVEQQPAVEPPEPAAFYPPEPQYVAPESGSRFVESDGKVDPDPVITQFPTVIQANPVAPVVASSSDAASTQGGDKRTAKGDEPWTIRVSDEPEVTTTVPRPDNAESLVARPVRRPAPDEPSGRIIFTTEG
ncbi:MazG family protein [Gordonia sp. (in: high G+C Gram-positive bacteria)]|uniref:MazG family protein n=1 Tax=Gordonia sp. (in: high G+C Gram-positive bacteria) TaxID=84139 RepID=UPI0039E4D364